MFTRIVRALSAGLVFAVISLMSVSEVSASPSVAVVVGVMEYVGVAPGLAHNGLYPSLGVAASFPVGEWWISPGFALELAPESGLWGIFPSVSLDIPLTSELKLNAIASASSDQRQLDFSDAAWYAGPGVGLSYALTDVWTLAASVNLYAGLNESAFPWSIAPGVALAYTVFP